MVTVLFRRLLRALPLVVGAMGTSSGALAEPSEPELEAARRSFSEGLRLEEYRDFVGALERFEAVASVKTTPQVRFHRALCLEKLGRWVDAREEFVRARDAAVASSGGRRFSNVTDTVESGSNLFLMRALTLLSRACRSSIRSKRTSAHACAPGGIMLRTTPALATVQFILSPVAGTERSRSCSI